MLPNQIAVAFFRSHAHDLEGGILKVPSFIRVIDLCLSQQCQHLIHASTLPRIVVDGQDGGFTQSIEGISIKVINVGELIVVKEDHSELTVLVQLTKGKGVDEIVLQVKDTEIDHLTECELGKGF